MTILDDNTVVVYSATELANAITGSNTYTYIYFGSDIILTSGISIPLAKNGIVIDGTYEGITYTYSDPNSALATGGIYFNSYNSSVPIMNITVKNLNVNLYNYYGVVAVHESAYAANTTITYDNLNIVGSQPVFNPYGITNFIDCTMNIGSASLNGEIVEGHIVNISGNTTINHSYTGYHGFSLRGGNGQAVNILDNANVTITCGRNMLYYAGNGDFTVGKNATLNLSCPYGLAYSNTNSAQNILFDTNSNVSIRRTTTAGAASLVFSISFTINSGANLYMQNTFSSNSAIYSATTGATININNPALIVINNPLTSAFYFTGTVNLNIKGKQLNQWNISPDIGDISFLPFYHWQKADYSIMELTGTATNTTTTITSNNFTTDELAKLPAISNLQLRITRTLSIGYLPVLSIGPITESTTVISGSVGPNDELIITTPYENFLVVGDSDTGNYSATLTTLLVEGDNIKFTSSNRNYLYNSRSVTVVYPGELTLYTVPNQIPFDLNTPVSTNPIILFGRNPNDWKLQVYDSRIVSSDWTLSANIKKHLTSDENNTLPDSLVYVDEDNNVTPLNENNTLVFTGQENGGSTKITDVNWEATKGILFTPNGNIMYKGQIYTTDINWDLEE